jgi:predicted N-acetyltransferase YhbS
MIDPHETPFRQPLDGGLTLRTAADEHDVDRVAAFNGSIHGPGIVPMTRDLFLRHPATRGRDLVFIEDTRSGEVVSSLCLIPWTWSLEGVRFISGEQGIVGTKPDYRRRGLIRVQVGYFMRRLQERGCVLSHIQGIPYYYRQFGYEYALPLEARLRLELRDVPAEATAFSPAEGEYTFRAATPDDIPTLARLYDDAAADLGLHAVRDAATWQYLFTGTAGSEMEAETLLIGTAAGVPAGYLRLPRCHFDPELLTVSEVSRLSYDATLAVLRHVRALAVERGLAGLKLNIPADNTLARTARALGGQDRGAYAWQIYVPDWAALLRALGPALERRVAASPFAGITCDVRICLFRETVVLHFTGGRVVQVDNAGFTGDEAINIPPRAFVPLVLGYRSREELCAQYPDLMVAPASRLLVDTLFPKVSAFIYTIY